MAPLSAKSLLRSAMVLALCAGWFATGAAAQTQDREDEIIANLAGGRVIVHVTKDEEITFAAINRPIEIGSVPPRVLDVDSTHIGILLGASEWRLPADPKPVRLDRDYQRVGAPDPHVRVDPNGAEPDLETIGVSFLERLRPLVSQLHHKIDVGADEPLFEVVLIGFAPRHDGPEVWTLEYRIHQEEVGTRAEYWQTRILRPRFEQLYPPEKKAPRKIVEASYPSLKGPTVQEMIEANDPRIQTLEGGDPRFAKVVEIVNRGQAQKAVSQDATDFMRALLPLLANNQTFILGTMDEEHGMRWVVAPEEPVEKAQKEKEDKDRPPEAPTLRKRSEQQ